MDAMIDVSTITLYDENLRNSIEDADLTENADKRGGDALKVIEVVPDAPSMRLLHDLIDGRRHFQAFLVAHSSLQLRVPTHERLFNTFWVGHVRGWRELEEQRAVPRSDVRRRRTGAYHASHKARR